MGNFKIIFTGPVGAGKSTAISSVSSIPPVSTEELATDSTRARKSHTTVAMDYGVMSLGGGEKIHLYGTPGQDRFDFMWEILTQGGIGLVLLIDNVRPSPLDDLRFFIKAFGAFINQTQLVVGITRMDIKPYPTHGEYHRQLVESGLNVPVFEVDARERSDVSVLLEALLYSLDPGVSI